MFVGLIHARVRIPGAVTEAGLQGRVMKVMMLWTWKKKQKFLLISVSDAWYPCFPFPVRFEVCA